MRNRHTTQPQLYSDLTASLILCTIMLGGAARSETIRIPAHTAMDGATYPIQITASKHGVVVNAGWMPIDFGQIPYGALAEATKRYPTARNFKLNWHAGLPGPSTEADCSAVYNRARTTIRCHGSTMTYDESVTWITTYDYLFDHVNDTTIVRLSNITGSADGRSSGRDLKICNARLLRMHVIEDTQRGKTHTVKRTHYP